jgi:hypothetical protein
LPRQGRPSDSGIGGDSQGTERWWEKKRPWINGSDGEVSFGLAPLGGSGEAARWQVAPQPRAGLEGWHTPEKEKVSGCQRRRMSVAVPGGPSWNARNNLVSMPATEDGLPRRSARVAAQGRQRVSNPEVQGAQRPDA